MAHAPTSTNKMQLGRESVAGTPVPATQVWRGPASDIEDLDEVIFVEEQIGILAPSTEAYIAAVGAQYAMPETPFTYEQGPHVLEAGVRTATPTGSSPYAYNYGMPVNATPVATKSYTIETGNSTVGDGNKMEYSFVEEFTLSGKVNEAWKIAALWRGRQKSAAAMTGSLTPAATEKALFNRTTLAISGSTITGSLEAFALKVKTGLKPIYSGDANQLTFHSIDRAQPEITFEISYRLTDATLVAVERAHKRARTVRKFVLTNVGTGGRGFSITIAAQYTKFATYEDANGFVVVKAEGSVRYSTAEAVWCDIVVSNLLASLP